MKGRGVRELSRRGTLALQGGEERRSPGSDVPGWSRFRAPRARQAITKPAALYGRRNDGGAGRGGYRAAWRADEPSTWNRKARLSGSQHGLLSLKAPDFSPGDVYDRIAPAAPGDDPPAAEAGDRLEAHADEEGDRQRMQEREPGGIARAPVGERAGHEAQSHLEER